MKLFIIEILSLCLAVPAAAADIREYFESIIVIEGEIVVGDYQRLETLVKGLGGRDRLEIYLATPGGDFFEGIEIGRYIREMKLPVTAVTGSTCRYLRKAGMVRSDQNCICASAGFFIAAGGVQRIGAEQILVHRPFVSKDILKKLSGSDSEKISQKLKLSANSYLNDMGLPQSMIDFVWSIPANKIERLPVDLQKRYFRKFIPEYEDWIASKCAEKELDCIDATVIQLQRDAYKTKYSNRQDDDSVGAFLVKHWIENHSFDLWKAPFSLGDRDLAGVKKKLGGKVHWDIESADEQAKADEWVNISFSGYHPKIIARFTNEDKTVGEINLFFPGEAFFKKRIGSKTYREMERVFEVITEKVIEANGNPDSLSEKTYPGTGSYEGSKVRTRVWNNIDGKKMTLHESRTLSGEARDINLNYGSEY